MATPFSSATAAWSALLGWMGGGGGDGTSATSGAAAAAAPVADAQRKCAAELVVGAGGADAAAAAGAPQNPAMSTSQAGSVATTPPPPPHPLPPASTTTICCSPVAMCDDLSVPFTVLYICRWLLTCASVRSLTFISSSTDFGVALSWPPRSWTASMNRAWSAVVHRIRGARTLLFEPPCSDALPGAARLNAHPCGACGRPASARTVGVPSPRLRPGGSAPELGFAKNPTSPLPSASVLAAGSVDCSGFAAAAGGPEEAVDEPAGGLIRRERLGRFLCNIAMSNQTTAQ